MNNFTNNPLTAHPLADQAEWWATDKTTKEAEAIQNHKVFDPVLTPYALPTKIEEGGKIVSTLNGSLTVAARRTKEGLSNV